MLLVSINTTSPFPSVILSTKKETFFHSHILSMAKTPAPNFYLKVNLDCCSACPRKAKEKLEKLSGVVGIAIDIKQGLVCVSGTVDPQKVVDKFSKWGRDAVIWSPAKDYSAHSSNTRQGEINKEKDCCHHAGDSNSDNESGNGSISWQHPDLVLNKAAGSKKKGKKWCWLFCRGKRGAVTNSSVRASGGKGGAATTSGLRPSGIHGGGGFSSSSGMKMGGHGGQVYPPDSRPMAYGRQAAVPLFPYQYPPPPSGYLQSGGMFHYTGDKI